MIETYSTDKEDIMQRWDLAAEIMKIPRKAYDMPVKIVSDKTRKSDYTFGVIYSPYRKKRPSQSDLEKCPMCIMSNDAQTDTRKNLFPDKEFGDFIVTPNHYPSTYGASLAITKKERPVYNTIGMKNLKNDLETITNLCVETGYGFFHQTEGAGATIPRHEHWQLMNWGDIYNRAGSIYGFDAAEMENVTGTEGVRFMPHFPFAHSIFGAGDFGRIESFLNSLQRNNPSLGDMASVPHTIMQGDGNILIVPFKGISERKLGSAHTAGHMYIHEEAQFNVADYNFCIEFLKQGLFLKEELDVRRYL